MCNAPPPQIWRRDVSICLEVDDRADVFSPNNLFLIHQHGLSHHADCGHVQLFGMDQSIHLTLAVR